MISGKARLAGLLGWPVSHSRSPRLHGHWLQKHGIDGAYLPLPVRPEDLAATLALLPRIGFVGVNVTVPHKEQALQLAQRVDPVARRIGAANTLVFAEDGTIEARNTDALGFIASLREGAPDWRADAGPALVLGAGGGVRAVIVALLDAGVTSIRLANRSRGRAEALAAELPGIELVDWSERAGACAGAELLVNGTSLGMNGGTSLDMPLDDLPRHALVTDLVYAPLETELLAAARARGNPTVDGLGMLLHQAVAGFEAWFGTRPSVTPELRRIVLEG